MSEWDDKINQLLVEIDALDDNHDKSSLEALWLKTLTIATGVDEPSAERLGELLNDVLDSFELEVIEQSSEQIDDIFNKLELLSPDSNNDQVGIIWTEFLYVMLGRDPNLDSFKQLVYCTLMPLESIEAIEGDYTEIDASFYNEEDDDLFDIEFDDSTFPEELLREDMDDIVDTEDTEDTEDAVDTEDTEDAVDTEDTEEDLFTISLDDDALWPKSINHFEDDEIISILNRLFNTYGIDATLNNIDELRSTECFEQIKGKLDVAPWCELRDNYKTSWSLIYGFFLKSKDAVFEDYHNERQAQPEQVESVKQLAPSSDPQFLNSVSAGEKIDTWPKHINKMSDEDIVSVFNRLFIKFHISATLNVEDLKEENRFMDIWFKLGSPEKCKLKGNYKQSWNFLYKFFIKDKNLVLFYPQYEQSTEIQQVNNNLVQKVEIQPEQPPKLIQTPKQGKRSYIKDYKGYLRCAYKHLEACKTILVTHDSIIHDADDSSPNFLVYEEIYYLSGYIMECSTMAALLKIIRWSDGDELSLLDDDEHEHIRETYHISWEKNFYGCHKLSSHFAGKRILDLIKRNNQLTTYFQDIPFLNGNHEDPFNGDNELDNCLCHEIFSDNRIVEKVKLWNNTVIRYRGLPIDDKRITRRDTILLIALCDMIVKKIIKNFHIPLDESHVDASLHSVNDSFQNIVSRYINKQHKNNSI